MAKVTAANTVFVVPEMISKSIKMAKDLIFSYKIKPPINYKFK
ncbi:hypothetical protein [Photorhabdus temperata]|nr:hypothetical protein [Photorhabdus temperata]